MDAHQFVKKHGIVMVSAKHEGIPSIAAEIAGEPIKGSWWAHPKSQEIYRVLVKLDADEDVVTTRLVDGKLTMVHKRLWPALAALMKAGRLDAKRLTRVESEHTEKGSHENRETPVAKWMPQMELPDPQEAVRQLGNLADELLKRGDGALRARHQR